MKNKDLIEYLQELDPEAEVYIPNDSNPAGGYTNLVSQVEHIEDYILIQ